MAMIIVYMRERLNQEPNFDFLYSALKDFYQIINNHESRDYGQIEKIIGYYSELPKTNLKRDYSGIEDPERYKERVTMDWGVKIVNDLEILAKESNKYHAKPTKKRKKVKNEDRRAKKSNRKTKG